MKEVWRYLKDLEFNSNDKPTFEELKKKWKELSRKFHPDRGGSDKEFHRITHAYKMLTDSSYRQKEAADDMRRGNHNAKGDLDIRVQVPVSFEDAFFGRHVVTSFGILEFTPEMKPVVKTEIEIVVVEADLPAGCVTGHVHTLPDKGHKCDKIRGGVQVMYVPQPHPRFRVEGADVFAEEEFPLDMMLKGGTADVLTMWGPKTLKIPPGTCPGEQLCIKKAGIQELGKHVVIVKPRFPNKDELHGEKWKGLEIDWGQEEGAPPDKEAEDLLQQFFKIKGVSFTWTK